MNRRREAKRLRLGGSFQRRFLSNERKEEKRKRLKVDDAAFATGLRQFLEAFALLGFVFAFDDDLK